MLNVLRFKFSVLLRKNTLLDKSLRVLQLPTHLSDSSEDLERICMIRYINYAN